MNEAADICGKQWKTMNRKTITYSYLIPWKYYPYVGFSHFKDGLVGCCSSPLRFDSLPFGGPVIIIIIYSLISPAAGSRSFFVCAKLLVLVPAASRFNQRWPQCPLPARKATVSIHCSKTKVFESKCKLSWPEHWTIWKTYRYLPIWNVYRIDTMSRRGRMRLEIEVFKTISSY